MKSTGYDNIYGCDVFFREREDLYHKDKEGKEKYALWLDKQLRFLDTMGLEVLSQRPKVFEKLSGCENLFSIRWREFRGNPRVLFFAVIEDDGQETFVLLTAFKELNAGDYKRAISVAENRRKQVLRDFYEEDDNNELS